jgi:hypothetical protein
MDGILLWLKVGAFIVIVLGVLGWALVVMCMALSPVILIAYRAWEERHAFSPLSSGGRYRILAGILAVTFISAFIWLNNYYNSALLMLVSFPFAYITLRCFGYARRFDARLAEDVVGSDSRPPVLYLRSFEDDRRVSSRVTASGLYIETEESELAKLFSSLGPLLAVGRPQEILSYAGAARFQFDNDDWQQRVLELLSGARLVLIRAGKSDGLLWEIQAVVRLVEPEKVLLLIPWGRRSYHQFRSTIGGVFPSGLPTYAGKYPKECFLAGVVFFDNDWTPHFSASSLGMRQLAADFFGPDLLSRTKSNHRRGLDHALLPVVGRWQRSNAIGE